MHQTLYVDAYHHSELQNAVNRLYMREGPNIYIHSDIGHVTNTKRCPRWMDASNLSERDKCVRKCIYIQNIILNCVWKSVASSRGAILMKRSVRLLINLMVGFAMCGSRVALHVTPRLIVVCKYICLTWCDLRAAKICERFEFDSQEHVGLKVSVFN